MKASEWTRVVARLAGMYPAQAYILTPEWIQEWYRPVADLAAEDVDEAIVRHTMSKDGQWVPNGGQLAALVRSAHGLRPADPGKVEAMLMREAGRVGRDGHPDFDRPGDHPVDAAAARSVVASIGWRPFCSLDLSWNREGIRHRARDAARAVTADVESGRLQISMGANTDAQLTDGPAAQLPVRRLT